MMHRIIFLFLALFLKSILNSQPIYKPAWYQQIQNDGALDMVQSMATTDSLKGTLTIVRIGSAAVLNGKNYSNSSGVKCIVEYLDSAGTLKWHLPLFSGKMGMINSCYRTAKGRFCFTFNATDSLRIGNVLSTGGGCKFISIDQHGVDIKIIDIPDVFYGMSITDKEEVLLKAGFVNSTSWAGHSFNPGFYALILDNRGSFVSNVFLGYSLIQSALLDCCIKNNSVFFTAKAEHKSPFLGNGFKITATDTVIYSGSYKPDIFIACLNLSGDYIWSQRVDSCAGAEMSNSLVADKDGNIWWAGRYYQSGNILGKRHFIKFKGEAAPFLAWLNGSTGAVLGLKSSDSFSGSSDSRCRIYLSDRGKSILALYQDPNAINKWTGLPDSARNLFNPLLISFESDGNYHRFAQAALVRSFAPDYWNAQYYKAADYFASSQTLYYLDDHELKAIGNGDRVLVCYTTVKSKIMAVNNSAITGFKLVPNPNSGIFRIFTPIGCTGQLQVCDMSGKIICQQRAENEGIFELELHDGIYLVNFVTNNGLAYSSKFVISR